MSIALAGHVVVCMHPSVALGKEAGSSKLSWDFALSEKPKCKRTVKNKRVQDCCWSFLRPSLGRLQMAPRDLGQGWGALTSNLSVSRFNFF